MSNIKQNKNQWQNISSVLHGKCVIVAIFVKLFNNSFDIYCFYYFISIIMINIYLAIFIRKFVQKIKKIQSNQKPNKVNKNTQVLL